ncbi:MAG: hypothetical protein H6719_36170, partial [Sandaracinaceae bacterium]|nr:hypothetical protein [Sandaracinaceae bacterium]
MHPGVERDAARMRGALARGDVTPREFRAAADRVPFTERDAWLDAILGIDEIPDDDPSLPRGCVPYLPCPVDTVLRATVLADVRADDVFVDVGSGLGRALVCAHLATGAEAIGLEVQPTLARAARRVAEELRLSRVATLEGDATELLGSVPTGTVFFLYSPFGGEHLRRALDELERIARVHP